MGATTTQGTGAGEALSKGPSNNRNMYESLLSPHIITGGIATLSGGGTVTVTFDKPLDYAASSYVVILTSTGSTTARNTSVTNNSAGVFSAFVITGGAAEVINYMVVKTGVSV